VIQALAERLVGDLQAAYTKYMSALKAVLDLGDSAVPTLVSAMGHKHANPVAVALGLMMHLPAARSAIPSAY